MPGLGPPATYEEALIREFYPGYASYFGISPEITLYLTAAAQQQWSPEKLKSVILASDWWKATPSTAREAINLQLTDPASWNQQVFNKGDELRRKLQAAGGLVDANMANFYAGVGMTAGLSDEQIFERFVMEQQTTESAYGELADITDRTEAAARTEWGLPIARGTAFSLAKQLLTGQANEAGINNYLRDQAKSMYANNAALADALDRGQTVRDYASPYLDMAARELEMNPADLDLTEGRWSRAFHNTTPEGQFQPMVLADWQKTIRSDSVYGWDNTTHAKEEGAQFSERIMQTMGAKG